MPTYEYACRSCGEHLEVVQSFKDEPLTECPGCNGELRKVFSPIGITFKGSGFYKTDSRSGAKTAAKTADTASASSGDSSSSTSSTSTSTSSSTGSSAGSGSGSSDKAAAAS